MELFNVEQIERVTLLKLMHHTMACINDESAYYDWIVEGVPDQPGEEDFFDIAEDTDQFNECYNFFYKLYKLYYKTGVVVNPVKEDLIDFIHTIDKSMNLETEIIEVRW